MRGNLPQDKIMSQFLKLNESTMQVLATLVRFGAPPQILVDGKPHLGTDKLVRILQNLRSHLLGLGVSDHSILYLSLRTKLEIVC